jgi:hypothetical protein
MYDNQFSHTCQEIFHNDYIIYNIIKNVIGLKAPLGDAVLT